ncbi:MAG: hypothetical protein ACT4O2_06305 [Beijerinckiaceae bacterium]
MDENDFALTKPAYSVREVVDLMPFGRTKVLSDIDAGRLEALRNGKTVVITRPAIVRYINSFAPPIAKTR